MGNERFKEYDGMMELFHELIGAERLVTVGKDDETGEWVVSWVRVK